jgi:hypothetical protein
VLSRRIVVVVIAVVATLCGTGTGWSRPSSGHVDDAAHASRSGNLFYVSETDGAILRHSFRTGHFAIVAKGLNGPTAIVKVGHRLVWEQQAGNACKRYRNADEIMSLSLARKSAKPRVLLGCLNDETEGGFVFSHGYLYIAMSNGIGRVGLHGRHFDRRYIALSQEADGASLNGLASDGSYLYFSRCLAGTIGRVAFNGSALSYGFVKTGYKSCPQAVAVGNGHIYWSDLNPIGRARLDGTHVQRNWLSIRSDEGPFFLAADAYHVYWDWGGAAGSPSYVGRVRTNRNDFTKPWARGQGAFLLTSPGANR